MDKEKELARQKSLESKKTSPQLKDAQIKDESSISTAEVSDSIIMALLVMMGDFKALKEGLPASRQTSSNGKIYWCAEFPGHILAIEKGNLLVDGIPAKSFVENLLEKIPASKKVLENILAEDK